MAESKTFLPGDAGVDVDVAGVDAHSAGGATPAVVGVGGVGPHGGVGGGEKNISQQPLLFSAVSLFSEIYISNPVSTSILSLD